MVSGKSESRMVELKVWDYGNVIEIGGVLFTWREHKN